MRFVRSIPLALGLLCQANMICNGQPANLTTGQALFEKVDPEIRKQLPEMLKEGLNQVNVEMGVTYVERSSGPLKLDIYRAISSDPKTTKAKQPAVVVIHGGSWKSGDRTQLGLYAASLARKGYVAYAIEYRLAPKYTWPAQWEDVRDAVVWVRKEAKNQGVDPDRIGAVGYSAGGHLASMLGAVGHKSFSDKNPEIMAKVNCVAAGGAPCDFTDMPLENTFLKYWLGSTRGDKPEVYHAASPLQLVSVASAPIMFYNGTFDLMVRPNSAKSLSQALAKFGIDTAQHLVPGAGHISAALDEKALLAAWAFLDKHLKPVKPKLEPATPIKSADPKPVPAVTKPETNKS